MNFQTKRLPFFICLAAIFMVTALPHPGHGIEGGYSNYIPLYGDFAIATPPPPGWSFRNDFYYYSADSNEDQLAAPGVIQRDIDLVIAVDFMSVFYLAKRRVLGGQYAFGLIESFAHTSVNTNLSAGPTNIKIDRHNTHVSDFTLAPFVFFWNKGRVYWAFGEFIVMPSGSYDVSRPVNAGLNYYSFDTNLAFTYLNPETGREFSFNLGHIYNTENRATRYQSGQEIHLDYFFNKYLRERVGVGVHGFYHKQIKGDTGEGAVLGAFKAEDAGIGPGLFLMPKIFGKDVPLIFRWLWEYHAENRLEGSYFIFSLAMDL